jgi:coniferyl-aldehyde dehydrogenase
LIDDARVNGATVEPVAPAGESLPDRATRKIAPTIVRDVEEHMRIAKEEIFGPVLVVRPYSHMTEAIAYINGRPAPLVAYWYGPTTPTSGPSFGIPVAAAWHVRTLGLR